MECVKCFDLCVHLPPGETLLLLIAGLNMSFIDIQYNEYYLLVQETDEPSTKKKKPNEKEGIAHNIV